ncbi:HlyD family efflux transporter periplasmic adaptor subunit [Botrimarina sp.]|uniref:HlyD family efflux transporter periplasmic adaptor subunit n=1 Tax=Botrimarina sp. TaxID=2795802 RepID=UPI0032ECDB58
MPRPLWIGLVVLALVAGFLVRGWVPLGGDHHDGVAHEEHDDDHDDHDDEGPHVALSEEAVATIGLELGQAQVADFTRTTAIPAEVVEFPGVSAHKLAAPVRGVVSAVAAEPGASVDPGDALFTIQITDEQVVEAQLRLIEALTRLAIVDEELERLRPLAASGAVSGRQRRDLEYERRELQTTIRLRRDELIVRGLPESRVEALVNSGRLLESISVRVPLREQEIARSAEPGAGANVQPVAWREAVPTEDFSVETLLVEPGQTVDRGQALCDLASHAQLYLRVQAFERDVPLLARLAESGETISAEFGHSLKTHGATSSIVDGLQVRYVANHVDPESQAYACYIPLVNEVLTESTGPAGRRYRTWRFSVGQRAHLLLPTTQIEGGIPLPADAVAISGPTAWVFRPHEHDDHEEDQDHHEGEAHEEEADHLDDDDHDDDHDDHEEPFLELEPVEVVVLHQDPRSVVVAADGNLSPGDTIAMNNAYQLRIAIDAAASGGGGHDHHHDH